MKGNVTILASIFVIATMMFSMGLGTMAYFSDTESSTGNNIAAGVLNIQIKDADQGFWDGTPVTASMSSPPGGLKPGQEFWTDVIELKNVGSIDAWYVYLHFRDLACSEGANPESEQTGDGNYLMDQIVLMEVWEYSPNMNGVGGTTTTTFDATTANSWLLFWSASAPIDGSISLYDIVTYGEPGGGSSTTSFRLHTGDGIDPSSNQPWNVVKPYLPAGGTVQVQFKFKLLENTDNRAQGDICSFNVDFIATQTIAVP
jgi:predicted ribosomally synthesized peptide with SipW-like signal peptide